MNDDLAGQIRRNLWNVADYFDEVLTPVTRAAGPKTAATSFNHPMPISDTAIDVRREVHQDLAFWAWFILEEIRDIDGRHMVSPFKLRMVPPQPKDLVKFIVIWVDKIVTDFPDDADNLATEAAEHLKTLRNLSDPARKDWVRLGTCPLDIDSENGPTPCGGEVRAKTIEGVEAQATCRGCGVTAVIIWWERILIPEASRLITAAELPEFVRTQFGKTIKAPTVRKWIERGVIESSGTDAKGRRLYDKGAVAYALARREVGA